MALHQRKVIRDFVVALLVGANTAAGARVTATRINPYKRNPAEFPAISVYTLDDVVNRERSITAPRELARELKLEIAAWVSPGDAVDDDMDAIALEIETAMHADPFLGDTASDSMLDQTTMALSGEGDRIMGLVTLTYAVTYWTLAPAAPTGLADFLTADTRHRIVGIIDPTQDGHDEIAVQEPL